LAAFGCAAAHLIRKSIYFLFSLILEINMEKKPYQAPKIQHKGQLKQFAGSPLGKDLGNPLGLPQK
jgi:hypothetical protein